MQDIEYKQKNARASSFCARCKPPVEFVERTASRKSSEGVRRVSCKQTIGIVQPSCQDLEESQRHCRRILEQLQENFGRYGYATRPFQRYDAR